MFRNLTALIITIAAFALLAFGLHAGEAADSEAVVRRMIALERQRSDIQPNLEYLCTAIGPRLSGSSNLQKANEWAAGKMKAYGLEDVKLEPFAVPVGWERGPCSLQVTSPYPMSLTVAQVAWTTGTADSVRAPILLFTPRTEAEVNGFRGRLRGAILITEDSASTPRPEGYASWTEPTPSPPIPALPVENAGQSAPAQIPASVRQKAEALIKEEVPAAILADSGKPHGLLSMWGGWGGQRSAYPTIITANHQYAHLIRLLKRGVAVKAELSAKSRFVTGPLTSHSTIGEIPGSDLKTETVLLGAHIDSWDLATGATDNGTGVAVVLEAARLLKSAGVKPRRTIRFSLFGGEEQSFGGSLGYMRNRKAEMERLSAVFIHDSGTGRVKGTSLEDRPECGPALLRQFNLAHKLGLMAEGPVIRPGRDPGSDHDPFNEAGIPAFALFQDPAEYGLTHHTNVDSLEYVRYPDLKQGALMMALLAYDTAQMETRFPRRGR